MTQHNNWMDEFDKQFGDPMTKKYGPGFALYCSICSTKGEVRDRIKDFIRKVRAEAIQEDRRRIETEANKHMDYLDRTLWLIWSNEHKGWWKANHKGYTQDLTEAGVYKYQEAVNIVYGANIALLYDNKAVPNEAMILLEGELEDKLKNKII